MYHCCIVCSTCLITAKTTGLTEEVYGAPNAFHYYSTTSVGKITRSEKYVASYAQAFVSGVRFFFGKISTKAGIRL